MMFVVDIVRAVNFFATKIRKFMVHLPKKCHICRAFQFAIIATEKKNQIRLSDVKLNAVV